MLRVNGFFGHIQRNNLRSMAMFLGFAVACQLIGMAMLVAPLLIFDRDYEPVSNFSNYMQFYGVAVFVFSALIFLVRFFLHVNSVKQNVHFELVNRLREPRLCKIIEIQAIGAGIAMPSVGIIEDDARNAFACGMSEHSAVVVVTRGLLLALDDDELEAVVAHEITHIVNGDIQLMAAANVMLSTLILLKDYNPVRLISNQLFFLYFLMPPLLILYFLTGFITSLGMTLGKLSRLLIASSREYIADAEAVRMTKNPAALISALRRIEGRSDIEGLDEAVDAMMIDGAVEGAYASHPTIAERIAVLAQHAGAMVHGTGTRKDTRNYGEFNVSQNGAFGQRLEVAKTFKKAISKTPDRSLINRVNAGSDEDAFGLTKKKRRFVLLALCTPFLIPMIFGFPTDIMDRTMGENPRQISATSSASGRSTASFSHVSNKIGAKARANEDLSWIDYKKTATRLAGMNPLEARCFGHEQNRYHVWDWGRETFKKPDPMRVKRMLQGKIKYSSDIEVANIAKMRIKSQRAIRSAVDQKSLNRAFWSYVTTRESTMINMHRFYGKKGLNWIRNIYESPRDKKIVAQIGKQYLQNPQTKKNNDYYKNVALLVDNSKHFIPCYARAVWGPPKKKKRKLNSNLRGSINVAG